MHDACLVNQDAPPPSFLRAPAHATATVAAMLKRRILFRILFNAIGNEIIMGLWRFLTTMTSAVSL